MTKFEIQVNGIHCNSCVQAISKALMALLGVEMVEVDASKTKVIVSANEQQINKATICAAISASGFDLVK